MRVPRVRFTVRRMMVAVAGFALASGLLVPAVRILSDPERRRVEHLWQRPDGSLLMTGHEVGFWDQYRRELGLPWACSFEYCQGNSRAYREIAQERIRETMFNRDVELGVPSSPRPQSGPEGIRDAKSERPVDLKAPSSPRPQ